MRNEIGEYPLVKLFELWDNAFAMQMICSDTLLCENPNYEMAEDKCTAT